MKMKTSELTGRALDYAVAKAEGLLLEPVAPASNEDVQGWGVPFTLWEVSQTTNTLTLECETLVTPITVTRYGINTDVGATAPSISFTDNQGRKALGSVNMFYLTEDDALKAAHGCTHGDFDEGYQPSEFWRLGGPIMEREGIDLYCSVPTNPEHEDVAWRGSWQACYRRCGVGTQRTFGPTALIAAMRAFVLFKLGDEVDVPKELA